MAFDEGALADPAMLVMAREARGMTQTELAEAMCKASAGESITVSQGYVSKAESGRLTVGGDRLRLYAAALGYPVALLLADVQVHGVGVGLVHHRKRASTSASALRRLHAQLALTRVQVEWLVTATGQRELGHDFPTVEVSDLVRPKDAARRVRKAWDMPAGPVADMVAALENAGALVVARDLGSDRLDAVSQWDGRQAPLILIAAHAPSDRRRFSLAHELGHLVMHRRPGSGPDQEKEADAFASEFLMPATDIRSDLTGTIDLARLISLKHTWRVSMAALLRRAQTLGTITDWHYRNVQVEMSALGYRTHEPVVLAHELPHRLPNLVARALDGGASVDDLAACARLLPDDFLQIYVRHAFGQDAYGDVGPVGDDDLEALVQRLPLPSSR